MADPLTLLRQYHEGGRLDDIIEQEGYIIFGDLAWPKDVNTNFKVYRSEANGKWDYYSLECLFYFAKNIKKTHTEYIRQGKGEVPLVHLPDRRDLIAYLSGEKKDLRSIDHSVPLQMPTNFKRTAEDKLDASIAKKPRLDQNQFKERLAAKLESQPEGGKISINEANLKDLSEDLTTDKIAQIRAKILSNRRSRIPEDDETKSTSFGLGELSLNRESNDIINRERVWRTRKTILQSAGKMFNKTIFATLASIKAREEGKMGKASMPPAMPNTVQRPSVHGGQRQQLPNYNRYDQEQFRGKEETHGFNIDTRQTFSGMTLKSVTEGSQAAKNKQMPSSQPSSIPRSIPGGGTPKISSGSTPKSASASPAQGASGKRPSRTPIIIIPAAPKSLITMYNARDILQDMRFISTEDKKSTGFKRENEMLIQRRKDVGLTVPYRVIDNPGKLTNADWDRVVAVFVMGQAWQFKGWPWEGNPTVIFSKIAAYHIKWDDSNLEKNIGNWAVRVIQLSREKRHLDRAKLMTFWETLDKHMVNYKPQLRF